MNIGLLSPATRSSTPYYGHEQTGVGSIVTSPTKMWPSLVPPPLNGPSALWGGDRTPLGCTRGGGILASGCRIAVIAVPPKIRPASYAVFETRVERKVPRACVLRQRTLRTARPAHSSKRWRRRPAHLSGTARVRVGACGAVVRERQCKTPALRAARRQLQRTKAESIAAGSSWRCPQRWRAERPTDRRAASFPSDRHAIRRLARKAAKG